jgi:hypothetical protein
MKITFIDAGVLVTAARGVGDISERVRSVKDMNCIKAF